MQITQLNELIYIYQGDKMDKEMEEVVLKVADYSNEEKRN